MFATRSHQKRIPFYCFVNLDNLQTDPDLNPMALKDQRLKNIQFKKLVFCVIKKFPTSTFISMKDMQTSSLGSGSVLKFFGESKSPSPDPQHVEIRFFLKMKLDSVFFHWHFYN
jgi:hypothetical protein